MQRRTSFAVRLPIAALAFAASGIALAPASHAAPAETCLKAPKGVAPQGSHWYYRIDRATQHRCWYLGEKGRGVAQRTTTRAAPPQADSDDEDAMSAPAVTAPVAAAPAMTAPPASAASQPAAEPPAPKITTLVTRNVSNADQPAPPPAATTAPQAQPVAAPAAANTPANEAPPLPPEQAPSNQQAAPAAESPAPQPAAVVEEKSAPAAAVSPTLQLVLGGIAFFGLIASAAFFILTLLRRRNDVLNMRREPDVLPYEQSPDMAADQGPAFQPLRALDPIRRRDDVDEAMQRVMRRRRAAA